MSAYYNLYKTPNPTGKDEKKPLHALVCSKGTYSADDLLERVSTFQHLPHAWLKGVIEAIGNELGDLLANGHNVELGNIGYFSTTLKCMRQTSNKKEIRGESVRFDNVKFRTSKEFKQYINQRMELQRAEKTSESKPYIAEDKIVRKELMLKFMDENVCITRAEHARLNQITDRKASYELQEFLSQGIIRKRGTGRTVVYIKN